MTLTNYRQDRQSDGTIKYFIRIDEKDIEVDKELYMAYSSMERRERYLAEKNAENCLSLDRFAESELSGDYLLDHCEESAEDMHINSIEADDKAAYLALLPQAIAMLTEKERQIVSDVIQYLLSTAEVAF